MKLFRIALCSLAMVAVASLTACSGGESEEVKVKDFTSEEKQAQDEEGFKQTELGLPEDAERAFFEVFGGTWTIQGGDSNTGPLKQMNDDIVKAVMAYDPADPETHKFALAPYAEGFEQWAKETPEDAKKLAERGITAKDLSSYTLDLTPIYELTRGGAQK